MIPPAQTVPDLLAALFGSPPPPVPTAPTKPVAQTDSPFLQLLAALAPPLHGSLPDAAAPPEFESIIPVEPPDESTSDSIVWLHLPPTPADGLTIAPPAPLPAAPPHAAKVDSIQPLPLGQPPVANLQNVAPIKAEPTSTIAPEKKAAAALNVDRSVIEPTPSAAIPKEAPVVHDIPLEPTPPAERRGVIKPLIPPSQPAREESPSPALHMTHHRRHSEEAPSPPAADVSVIARVAPPEVKRERPTAVVVERLEDAPTLITSPASEAPAMARGVEPPPALPAMTWPETVEHVVREAPAELKETGLAEFHIRVTPPDLGPVRIRLTSQRHEVTAELTVASDAIRDLVEIRLPELRQRLESAGMAVGSFSVTQDGNPRGDSRRAPADERREAPRSGGSKPVTPRGPTVRLGVIDVTV